MAASFETMLVPPEGIKTKRGYVSATRSKAVTKLAPRSLNKKLVAHHIVGFVNQKQKAEFCPGGNQAAQIQNQNSALNANSRPSKPDATSASGNKPAPPSIRCFNCQGTGHYSRNCPNLENKRPRGLGNEKGQ